LPSAPDALASALRQGAAQGLWRPAVLEEERGCDRRIPRLSLDRDADLVRVQENLSELAVVETADVGDVGETAMLELYDLVEATIQRPFALHVGRSHAAPPRSCRVRPPRNDRSMQREGRRPVASTGLQCATARVTLCLFR
jgi:hypothetical protein